MFLGNFTKFTENTCATLFFNKVTGLGPAKRDPGTGVFQWILRNFEEHLFFRAPPDDYFYRVSPVYRFILLLKLTVLYYFGIQINKCSNNDIKTSVLMILKHLQ